MTDPTELARWLQRYASRYDNGAGFSTPVAGELAKHPPGSIYDVTTPDGRAVVISKRLTRVSTRRDFVGRKYQLPAGALVAGTVARIGDAPLPEFDRYDFVYAYLDDYDLTAEVSAGRDLHALQITAAGEMVGCWGLPGTALGYDPVDLVTVGRVNATPTAAQVEAMRAEAVGLTGWDDDYPFYSDGSWSALNLRGFYPEDPSKGIKPSEMPKAWQVDNAADLNRACEWTRLAERCPTIVEFVTSVPWWRRFERVRLLRMAGRDGRGGALKRHTDITDRAAGTRNDQIARFHIALQTHPDIKMTAWQFDGHPIAIHLAPGEAWYLDQRKPHAVKNPTGVDRIHLVVDVLCDDDVRRNIKAARP